MESLAFCVAIYANLAGALSFAQIVKAGEALLMALVGQLVFRSRISRSEGMCLFPVVGGIMLASAEARRGACEESESCEESEVSTRV